MFKCNDSQLSSPDFPLEVTGHKKPVKRFNMSKGYFQDNHTHSVLEILFLVHMDPP